MLKIYKYLLNREPNSIEINNNKNKSIKELNKEIINSEEYRQFTEHIKQIIIKNYCDVFNVDTNDINLNGIDLFNKMKFLRNNNYNLGKLNEIILKRLIETNNYLNNFFKHFKNKPKQTLKDIYIDLINNNFNYIEMEFNIINSNCFIV